MRRHFLKNELHVAMIGLELAQDFVDQRLILDHQQMSIENARVFRADRFGDLLLHLENLRARLDERGLEARDLIRDWLGSIRCCDTSSESSLTNGWSPGRCRGKRPRR